MCPAPHLPSCPCNPTMQTSSPRSTANSLLHQRPIASPHALHDSIPPLPRSGIPLPSWLVFPFLELFLAAFLLVSLSSSAAQLLAAAAVTGRAAPAAVGGVVAAALVAFVAAAGWVVVSWAGETPVQAAPEACMVLPCRTATRNCCEIPRQHRFSPCRLVACVEGKGWEFV